MLVPFLQAWFGHCSPVLCHHISMAGLQPEFPAAHVFAASFKLQRSFIIATMAVSAQAQLCSFDGICWLQTGAGGFTII